jgi:probable rRNA maturation factor
VSLPLRVLVADERGRPAAAAGLARWLARVAPSRVRGTVHIAMVSDAKVRALNRRYRRVDHATDVLSFPVESLPRTPRSRLRSRSNDASYGPARRSAGAAAAASPQPPASSLLLGDIVIARGVARRQAREAHHSEGIELRVLALHGLLHLIGYDHERDDGRMRRVEQRLRRKGGLRAGLIERAGVSRAPSAPAAPKPGEHRERRRGRRARNR